MQPIIKYILLCGIRDRLYLGLFFTLIVSFAISIFLGSTALVEEQQTSLIYLAGSSRIIFIVGIILFTCLNIARAFENKEVEFVISKAISREKFILSYLSGFFLSALLIFIPLILAVLLFFKPNKFGLLLWSSSFFFESLIVISFALLASLILRNSFLAIMSSLAFYIISRLIGILAISVNSAQNFVATNSNIFNKIAQFIAMIFPRLDLFAQSSWLAYDVSDLSFLKIIFLQVAIYIPLLIFMAFHDFKKKQF